MGLDFGLEQPDYGSGRDVADDGAAPLEGLRCVGNGTDGVTAVVEGACHGSSSWGRITSIDKRVTGPVMRWRAIVEAFRRSSSDVVLAVGGGKIGAVDARGASSVSSVSRVPSVALGGHCQRKIS